MKGKKMAHKTKISKRMALKFPRKLVEKPIIYTLVKEYDLEFNILKASVTPEEEGFMVLELTGSDEGFGKAMKYLADLGVKIEPLGQDIVRNERCTHCGACVTICPAESLVLDKKTRKVIFDDKKCIACELCIKVCPVRAMEVHF